MYPSKRAKSKSTEDMFFFGPAALHGSYAINDGCMRLINISYHLELYFRTRGSYERKGIDKPHAVGGKYTFQKSADIP
jgi:hypothetical protein